MSEQPIDCNQPPPGLPPEFLDDWRKAISGVATPWEDKARWRAALAEIAALNMQVVSNAKASEAERERLRAELGEEIKRHDHLASQVLDLRDEVERLKQRDYFKTNEDELARLRSVITKKDAALVSIIESDNEVPGWAKQIAREARALS